MDHITSSRGGHIILALQGENGSTATSAAMMFVVGQRRLTLRRMMFGVSSLYFSHKYFLTSTTGHDQY
jgi:hypothetical protein